MSITAERKAEVISDNARAKGDTGSPEVQVAILTDRINTLTSHFKAHHKDNHDCFDAIVGGKDQTLIGGHPSGKPETHLRERGIRS